MDVAIVLGAGDGIGGTVGRRFARGGLHVVLVRRDADHAESMAEALRAEGLHASAATTDVRDEMAMTALFDSVEAEFGPIEVCVYNAGANTQRSLLDTSPKLFRQMWELACFGGFLAARECARLMGPRGRGTLLYTGATSALVARSGYAGFASAKFALRAVAQATARELGPLGIHVGHVVIDCAVKTEAIRKMLAMRDVDVDSMPENSMATPDSIAEAYWYLHSQPRDAWSHEIDLRPLSENW